MELALNNNIRLGNGGESSVEWVYLSGSQKALRVFIFILEEHDFNNAIHILRPFFLKMWKCAITSAKRLPSMYSDWPHFRGHFPIGILATE